MRRHHERRAVSEVVGVLLMLAIVVTMGVLVFGFASGGMASLSGSYAAAMAGQAKAVSEKFAVQQVAFTIGSPGALALDGSNTALFSTTNTGPVTLTTTNSNDVIVVLVTNEDATNGAIRTVSGVSATGLVFAKRGSGVSLGTPTFQEAELWWAVAASPLAAASITVTLSGSTDDAAIVAFGVNGANTVSPWDPNVALPATATGAAGTVPTVGGVSTSNANDMILGLQGNGNGAAVAATIETNGAGFNLIQNVDNEGAVNAEDAAAEYKVVSTTQSGTSVAFGTATTASDAWMMIGDAIEASPPATSGADVYVRNVGPIPTTLASVYIMDVTSNTFVSQTTISTTVNVGNFVEIPHTTLTFTPSHGHTYSFTVTSSLGNGVVYSAEAI